MASTVHVLWTNEFDLYKNGDHRRFCAKVKLFNNDIKTNPGGRPINDVDPTLIVEAPYIEGDITVFGATARQQCFAMSLRVLIYNKFKSKD